MTGDDFGTQDNLLISPDDWKKNLKSGFSQYIDIAHSYDVSIMHHTCGSIYDLIPEFIDCGLDILQSIQPDASNMDLEKIKNNMGSVLAEDALNTVFLPKTPHIVTLYIMPQMRWNHENYCFYRGL